MPSNDERREVAARLRECSGLHEFEEIFGFSWEDESDWYWSDVTAKVADLIEPEPINGETSDGYHTFNELYHHRALLFSVVVRNYPELCWKAKKHHTGDMYEGMFIVGINTPDGQASYHYDIDPYWDMFDCEELEIAPEWDGHTPDQAIERIGKLARHEPEERARRPRLHGNEFGMHDMHCGECRNLMLIQRDGTEEWPFYCCQCGTRVEVG